MVTCLPHHVNTPGPDQGPMGQSLHTSTLPAQSAISLCLRWCLSFGKGRGNWLPVVTGQCRVHSHSQPKVCTHSFTHSHPHPQDSVCYFKDAEWKDVSAFAFYFHFCFKESSSRKTVGWKSHLKLRLRHNEWAKVSCSVSTLCDPMDCSSPGSSVQGISQARILERVAISFSRWSSQPRDWTRVCCTAGGFFATEPPPPALSDLKEITK